MNSLSDLCKEFCLLLKESGHANKKDFSSEESRIFMSIQSDFIEKSQNPGYLEQIVKIAKRTEHAHDIDLSTEEFQSEICLKLEEMDYQDLQRAALKKDRDGFDTFIPVRAAMLICRDYKKNQEFQTVEYQEHLADVDQQESEEIVEADQAQASELKTHTAPEQILVGALSQITQVAYEGKAQEISEKLKLFLEGKNATNNSLEERMHIVHHTWEGIKKLEIPASDFFKGESLEFSMMLFVLSRALSYEDMYILLSDFYKQDSAIIPCHSIADTTKSIFMESMKFSIQKMKKISKMQKGI